MKWPLYWLSGSTIFDQSSLFSKSNLQYASDYILLINHINPFKEIWKYGVFYGSLLLGNSNSIEHMKNTESNDIQYESV